MMFMHSKVNHLDLHRCQLEIMLTLIMLRTQGNKTSSWITKEEDLCPKSHKWRQEVGLDLKKICMGKTTKKFQQIFQQKA